MDGQDVTTATPQLTSDDLVLLIGEREVKLFQARREQAVLVEQTQAILKRERDGAAFALEAKIKAAVEECTKSLKADCDKMTANVERMRGEVAKAQQAADERCRAMQSAVDRYRQQIDEATAAAREWQARAEKAEAELARRNKRARNLRKK
jgi:SMC interacting uncharacterized protein involved in chromosome segregation